MAARKGSRKGQRKQLPWRRDHAALARMQEVSRLHLSGWSGRRIAAELGVTEATIRNDIARLNELWIERVNDTQESLRAKAAAKLEEVMVQAFEVAERHRTLTLAVLCGEPFELDGTTKSIRYDENGKASFRGQEVAALGTARQAIMDQAKVLGIVVDKVAQTDGEGNDLSLADLAARAREARAQREAAAPAHG